MSDYFLALDPSSGIHCQNEVKKNAVSFLCNCRRSIHSMDCGLETAERTTWPIEMAWTHFSCMSHGAKQLAWMLKGAVLPCQWPHRHSWDGVTLLLPAGFLQGAQEQDSLVGRCTLGGLSTSAGSEVALCHQQPCIDVLRAACWQRKQYDKN